MSAGFDCAVACMYAHDAICRCACGGINHGRLKREWGGYFCETCDLWLGRNAQGVWRMGAALGSGRSKRHMSKAGKPQNAFYCAYCVAKWKPSGAQQYVIVADDGRWRWSGDWHKWQPAIARAA